MLPVMIIQELTNKLRKWLCYQRSQKKANTTFSLFNTYEKQCHFICAYLKRKILKLCIIVYLFVRAKYGIYVKYVLYVDYREIYIKNLSNERQEQITNTNPK